MSKNEIVAQIEALNEWESVIAEAQAEAEAIRDSIKAEMLDRDAEELQAGKYIVRWTPVLSNRFDSTSFKKTVRGTVQSLRQTSQQPPILNQRMKTAPCLNADQSHRQETNARAYQERA